MPKILIVDDDQLMRDMLRIHLTNAGHKVTLAADATEGIRALLDTDFDLIVCDFNMPYMDGLELTAAIRTDPKTAHIPVIMFTGSREEEVARRALELGTTLINKPIQAQEFMGEVARLLGSRPNPPA
jgi:CheY-like chemotaxis protein